MDLKYFQPQKLGEFYIIRAAAGWLAYGSRLVLLNLGWLLLFSVCFPNLQLLSLMLDEIHYARAAATAYNSRSRSMQ
jgi:hypothetical protein